MAMFGILEFDVCDELIHEITLTAASDVIHENFNERLEKLSDLESGEQIRIGFQKYRVVHVEENYVTCVECYGEGNQIVIEAKRIHLIRRRPPLLREIEQSTRGSNEHSG